MEQTRNPRVGRWRRIAMAVPFALALSQLSGSDPAAPGAQLGRQGRLQLRQLEMGYVFGDKSLKIRAHTVSGLAVELRTSEAGEIDRILRMADLLASGRARLFVELEGDAIRSLDASIP
jgi:hypothetical protein